MTNKNYIDEINREIYNALGETGCKVEVDKARSRCDIRLLDDDDPVINRETRNRVAAFIFLHHREITTIAYGGAMYTRDSLLRGAFNLPW